MLPDTYIDTITDFLSELKEQDRIDPDVNLLRDSIIDSFELIKMIGFLENKFDIEFSADDLVPDNFTSIRTIADLVRNTASKG